MNPIGLLCCGFLLFLLVVGALCYYIFALVLLDAKNRGIKDPKFWSLLAAGGQRGEGLLLYLFKRQKTISTLDSDETAVFLQLKRKIYYLLALLIVIFILLIVAIFHFS